MDKVAQDCSILQGAQHCNCCSPDKELEQLWGKAEEFPPNGEQLGKNLTVPSLVMPSNQETKQLEVFPFRPQLAPKSIIRNSTNEKDLAKARLATASQCISLLKLFSPNCPICYSETGGKVRMKAKHQNIGSCHGNYGGHFSWFYEVNKPGKVRELTIWKGMAKEPLQQGGWDYDRSTGYWCYACTMPQQALVGQGLKHNMRDCSWSDVISAVAWSVWHNEKVFEEMKHVVPCGLLCASSYPSGDSRQWWKWFVGQNEKWDGYNCHLLWLWYFENFIKGRL